MIAQAWGLCKRSRYDAMRHKAHAGLDSNGRFGYSWRQMSLPRWSAVKAAVFSHGRSVLVFFLCKEA